MFETKPNTNLAQLIVSQFNAATKQSNSQNKNQKETHHQLPKTECSDGVCIVNWRPAPRFYANHS